MGRENAKNKYLFVIFLGGPWLLFSLVGHVGSALQLMLQASEQNGNAAKAAAAVASAPQGFGAFQVGMPMGLGVGGALCTCAVTSPPRVDSS